MDFRRFFDLALAVFVTAGLALAPLRAPVAATPAQPAGMTDISMSTEMPRCPDEQKSKDCLDCPLVAICALKNIQAAAWTGALPVRHGIRTSHLVADDVFADRLNRPPPHQPPRKLA
jgi:hypothetical protein